MSNELMHDRNQPALEEGTVEAVMTTTVMRKTIVKVEFAPRRPKLPPIRARRWEFPTIVAANEFIQSINPPPGLQLGSPKQLKAKIARRLRLPDVGALNNYELVISTETGQSASVGVDTGDIDKEVETFTEGQPAILEPVTAEEILAAADTIDPSSLEFPE